MSKIQVNYEEARRCAQKLTALSTECEDIKRNLLNTLLEISEGWSGMAADSYFALLQRRINEVDKMRKEAESLAAQIKTVADRFETAEAQITAGMRQGMTSGSGFSSGSSGGAF